MDPPNDGALNGYSLCLTLYHCSQVRSQLQTSSFCLHFHTAYRNTFPGSTGFGAPERLSVSRKDKPLPALVRHGHFRWRCKGGKGISSTAIHFIVPVGLFISIQSHSSACVFQRVVRSSLLLNYDSEIVPHQVS